MAEFVMLHTLPQPCLIVPSVGLCGCSLTQVKPLESGFGKICLGSSRRYLCFGSNSKCLGEIRFPSSSRRFDPALREHAGFASGFSTSSNLLAHPPAALAIGKDPGSSLMARLSLSKQYETKHFDTHHNNDDSLPPKWVPICSNSRDSGRP